MNILATKKYKRNDHFEIYNKSVKPIFSFDFWMNDHKKWLNYSLQFASYKGIIEKALESFSFKIQILELKLDYDKLLFQIKERLDKTNLEKEFIKCLYEALEYNVIKKNKYCVQIRDIKALYPHSYPTIRKRLDQLRENLNLEKPLKHEHKCFREKDLLYLISQSKYDS